MTHLSFNYGDEANLAFRTAIPSIIHSKKDRSHQDSVVNMLYGDILLEKSGVLLVNYAKLYARLKLLQLKLRNVKMEVGGLPDMILI